ncbi:glyoxalase [Pleurocapsa sp. CCALA 161]|uniref:glyoxalase n=1 Tax=Pleurocapsa sp. CCALA 161 TaxID=2107688 RepID=UPI000D04A7C1|nr:glyoxalase [Pleurocapsa sp. CCALA 161]PSB08120.1 glyoxalase [Pleurocapsa sp. CCALA 161]
MKSNYSDIFVTLSTDKIQLMVDFYSQLLNQQPTIYQPGIYAEFQLQELKIAIFQPKAERLAEFSNQSSSMSLCLEVINLVEAIAHISDLGYPPPGEIIEASHGREVYAYDPGNNRLILHQSLVK